MQFAVRLFALAAVLFSLSGGALAWSSPKEALDRYLAFELDGGRLQGDNWNAYVGRYVAVPDGYDEPGWDRVVVVRSFRAAAPVCRYDNQCTVRVRYELMPTAGLHDEGVVEQGKGGSKSVTYNLVRIDADWRVLAEAGIPHVREDAYRKFRSNTR